MSIGVNEASWSNSVAIDIIRCPIHKKLIDLSLITTEEKAWLNAYHAEILQKVSPLLQDDQRALDWLKRECSPL